jgi:hypothetical protein
MKVEAAVAAVELAALSASAATAAVQMAARQLEMEVEAAVAAVELAALSASAVTAAVLMAAWQLEVGMSQQQRAGGPRVMEVMQPQLQQPAVGVQQWPCWRSTSSRRRVGRLVWYGWEVW